MSAQPWPERRREYLETRGCVSFPRVPTQRQIGPTRRKLRAENARLRKELELVTRALRVCQQKLDLSLAPRRVISGEVAVVERPEVMKAAHA